VSTKKKTDVIWFRFKFSGDVKTRAAVIRAADRMFRQIPGVIERRDYTEEEAAQMAKDAFLAARRKQTFTPAEIMEARDQRASITITQTNTDEAPRVRIEWPDGEVSEGVLKQNRKESAE
jgi:hypothetical protein